MCNVCNSYGRTSSYCNGGSWLTSLINGLSTTNSNGCGCGCNSCCGTTQRVCRDSYGCLRIQNVQSGCCNCCHNCHCCQQNCCNNNSNGSTGNTNGNSNGNGGFACITLCGNQSYGTAQTTSAFNGEAYYARQYGLNAFGNSRGCGCNSGYGYNA